VGAFILITMGGRLPRAIAGIIGTGSVGGAALITLLMDLNFFLPRLHSTRLLGIG
jgi:hypothetical protein